MSCVVLTLLLTGCHGMSASESTTTTTVYDVYNGIDDIVIDGLSEEDNKYINSQEQTLDTMYIYVRDDSLLINIEFDKMIEFHGEQSTDNEYYFEELSSSAYNSFYEYKEFSSTELLENFLNNNPTAYYNGEEISKEVIELD